VVWKGDRSGLGNLQTGRTATATRCATETWCGCCGRLVRLMTTKTNRPHMPMRDGTLTRISRNPNNLHDLVRGRCHDDHRVQRVVYYESMNRKLKIKPIYECRCDGRLQTKRFTRLSHTGGSCDGMGRPGGSGLCGAGASPRNRRRTRKTSKVEKEVEVVSDMVYTSSQKKDMSVPMLNSSVPKLVCGPRPFPNDRIVTSVFKSYNPHGPVTSIGGVRTVLLEDPSIF
jgi:hypothetical protein